jgi:hypothetical protein
MFEGGGDDPRVGDDGQQLQCRAAARAELPIDAEISARCDAACAPARLCASASG